MRSLFQSGRSWWTILYLGIVVFAYLQVKFFDGLLIATTQSKLAKETEANLTFISLASKADYEPLFGSYSRELALLEKLLIAIKSGEPEELASLVSRSSLGSNSLFKPVLAAASKNQPAVEAEDEETSKSETSAAMAAEQVEVLSPKPRAEISPEVLAAAKLLFLELARPAIDDWTVYSYRQMQSIATAAGVKLPPLRTAS